jgi:hypothetical protein
MQKEKKNEKLTRLELVTDATKRQFSHQNSVVLHNKQELLMLEQAQIDSSIKHLETALEIHKERREVVGATLTGLAEVLSCR